MLFSFTTADGMTLTLIEGLVVRTYITLSSKYLNQAEPTSRRLSNTGASGLFTK